MNWHANAQEFFRILNFICLHCAQNLNCFALCAKTEELKNVATLGYWMTQIMLSCWAATNIRNHGHAFRPA
jgi:hypothetical protein